jgi:hypothetical protein
MHPILESTMCRQTGHERIAPKPRAIRYRWIMIGNHPSSSQLHALPGVVVMMKAAVRAYETRRL